MSFIIMMDSDSDVSYQYAEQHDIPIISMPYVMDGKEYKDDSGRWDGASKFFEAMRQGAAPTTSLITTEEYKEIFRPVMDRKQDILYIAFSFQMSATQKNAIEAAEYLIANEYPGQRLEVVDTLSISAGVTALAMEAVKMRDAGRTLDEVRDWIIANRLNAQHWFMVEDLKYLRRGGRISATSAVFGTVLDIKPVLTVNAEGLVAAHSKAKGRKKGIRALLDSVVSYCDPNGTVCLLQAECQQDAERLADMIREALPGIGEVVIYPVGPVVGAHAGPGTLGACFLGKPRSEVKP